MSAALATQAASPPASATSGSHRAPLRDWTGYLTNGEVAREYDVTPRALRFYESKGLMKPVRRGQVRLYSPKDIVRLQLVLKGKQLGFTLTEIVVLLGREDENDSDELVLTREQTLTQIAYLEQQHRSIETALGELRKRYYLMGELEA